MTKLNRRQFLGASMGAAAAGAHWAIAPGTVLGANERIRVGLIGCGGMGRGNLRVFLNQAGVECPVLCDVDDKHLAMTVDMVESVHDTTPETTKDFRRVLDRSDIDAVIVATPDHWHALPTVLACQAGKDVYVEKPLANSVDEGRAMVEAAKRHERVVQMGTQWRSGAHFNEAVDWVRSGKLGKVRLVRAWAYLDWVGGIGSPPDAGPPEGVDYDMWLGPAPLRPFNPHRFHFNFRWFWDYAGGLMTDWGVHLINLALWAMGPEWPNSVYSTGGKRVVDDHTETPDTQVAVYDFPSYTLIWEHQILGGVGPNNRPHGLSFSGSDATLILTADDWEVIPEPARKDEVPVASGKTSGDGRPEHIANFLECIRTREQPVEHLELGHHVSSVAHLGNLALRSNTRVDWDAENERVIDNPVADAYVGPPYRAPWQLPYRRRQG